MLITTHVVVGAAIGFYSGNVFAGFLIGWLSHYLLDALPHFDRGSIHLKKTGPVYLNSFFGVFKEKKQKISGGKLSAKEWAIIIPDIAATILIIGFLFWFFPLENFILIFAGAAGAVSPDVLSAIFFFWPKAGQKLPTFYQYQKLHHFFHWTVNQNNAIWGILIQIFILLGAIVLLFLKFH